MLKESGVFSCKIVERKEREIWENNILGLFYGT